MFSEVPCEVPRIERILVNCRRHVVIVVLAPTFSSVLRKKALALSFRGHGYNMKTRRSKDGVLVTLWTYGALQYRPMSHVEWSKVLNAGVARGQVARVVAYAKHL